MKTKSALSYFGSDSEVAKEIAAHFNNCKHVTIPFAGGMSILPFLTARAIVANDLNENAINFYRHAKGVYGPDVQLQLFERCEYTLSHPSELDDAQARLINSPAWKGSWMRAWAYWAQCWIGRRIRAAASDLKAWATHFERCEFECIDFRKLFPKIADNKTCGVYIDAPWFGAGDAYIHSFSEADHVQLRNEAERFKETTILIRYGDCQFIRDLYSTTRWTILDKSSRDQCNKMKGEIWIVPKR